jgi:hypothetical protein
MRLFRPWMGKFLDFIGHMPLCEIHTTTVFKKIVMNLGYMWTAFSYII